MFSFKIHSKWVVGTIYTEKRTLWAQDKSWLHFVYFHSILFNFIHFHSFSFIFIQFHSFSFNFVHFCSISFIFVQFRSILFNIVHTKWPNFVPNFVKLLNDNLQSISSSTLIKSPFNSYWCRILSHMRPFYERAVSNLDP